MSRVMVVDDEQDLREMIHLIVKKQGIEVAMAENGEDFLEKIDRFHPDLVTLDVMMPGLTTQEILEKLKKKKNHPKIVLLTVVRYSEKEKQNLFDTGNIVDYLTKPFEVNDLIHTIKKHLAKN
jgi:DNA-binding response OmpR family regulator